MATEDYSSIFRDCTGCGENKQINEFHRSVKGKYGHVSRCISCCKVYAKENVKRINDVSLAGYHRRQEPVKEAKRLERVLLLSKTSKTCAACSVDKPIDMFSPANGRTDGLRPYCKECNNKKNAERRKLDPDSSYRYSRKWAEKNPDKVKQKMRRHQAKPSYRVHSAISSRIYRALKNIGAAETKKNTEAIVGYKTEVLMAHLERQFVKGMDWSNYGDWHIDHIQPLSSFDIKSRYDSEIKEAWSLSNLRPIWATENIRKNDKRVFLV